MSAKNYYIFAIPVAYVMAFIPHAISASVARKALNGVWGNDNPRGNLAEYRDKLPKDVYEKAYRAEAASLNGFEGFPFFAAAMVLGEKIVGSIGGLPAAKLNTYAAAYLVNRVLYNIIYIWFSTNQA